MEKTTIIKCPHCGCEYLPCEIFLPKDFLGTSRNVVKDDEGKILSFDKASMDTHEEYICDKCGKLFKVDAKVEFTTSKEAVDFDDDFVEVLN